MNQLLSLESLRAYMIILQGEHHPENKVAPARQTVTARNPRTMISFRYNTENNTVDAAKTGRETRTGHDGRECTPENNKRT